ncbi:MAG: phasin family protein [Tateyamaria sp.]
MPQPDTPERQTAPSRDPARAMFDAVTQWQGAGLGALNWLGASTAKQMHAMGTDWVVFVAERVREDVALQHALLHARSPGDVQRIQMQFLQKAMDQYAAETGRMIERSTRLFEPQSGSDENTDNVNV